jgi:hypothetical protein
MPVDWLSDRGDGARGKEEGEGLCPSTPLKAEPLKSTSFRQGDGDPGQISGTTEVAPSPCLKLKGSEGFALSGGPGGRAPWPFFLPRAPSHPSDMRSQVGWRLWICDNFMAGSHKRDFQYAKEGISLAQAVRAAVEFGMGLCACVVRYPALTGRMGTFGSQRLPDVKPPC